MTERPFDFSAMVCFSLYATSNAMIREYRPQLDEFGLTYPQFLVMMSLWNSDAVPIKALSEETLLDAATLTPVLKRLEDKGYVLREKSRQDERAKVIKLTADGLALRDKTTHIFKTMECRIQLSDEEQQQVTGICRKILKRLQES